MDSSKKFFTNFEKQLLLGLVEKYKSTVENKKINAITNRQKQAAWINIEKEFNSQPNITCSRNKKQLLFCYKNIKARTNKLLRANEQLESPKIGDESVIKNNDTISSCILSIGGTTTPLQEKFDSEGGSHNNLCTEEKEMCAAEKSLVNPESGIITCNNAVINEDLDRTKSQNGDLPQASPSKRQKRKNAVSSSKQRFIKYIQEETKAAEEERLVRLKILRTQLEVEETTLQLKKKKLEIYNKLLDEIGNKKLILQL